MAAILVGSVIIMQLGMALFSPIGLLYVSLLTGALPLTLGREGMLAGFLGRLDLSAMRLLGFWLAAGLVLLLQLRRSTPYLVRYPVHIAFLLFGVLALWWAPSLLYGARMLAKLSSPLLALLLVMLAVTTAGQLKVMERLMIGGGVLVVSISLVTTAAGWGGESVGLTVPGIGPALFSAFTVVIAILALVRMRDEQPAANLLILLVMAAATLAAFTRITIAGLFLGCSVVLFLSARGLWRVLLPVAGTCGGILLFFLSDTFKSRMFVDPGKIAFAALLEDPGAVLSHVHGSGRFVAWAFAMKEFFLPSPLIGSGIGATQHYYYSQSATGLGVIHSEYVRLLSEVGAVGLLLFLAAMLVYLIRLARTYRAAPNTASGRYALAGIGGLVAYLVFMATDNAFDYVNGFGLYVFCLVGMSEKARELEALDAELVPVAVEAEGSDPLPAGGTPARRFPLLGEA
jgi:O-antigen ligase